MKWYYYQHTEVNWSQSNWLRVGFEPRSATLKVCILLIMPLGLSRIVMLLQECKLLTGDIEKAVWHHHMALKTCAQLHEGCQPPPCTRILPVHMWCHCGFSQDKPTCASYLRALLALSLWSLICLSLYHDASQLSGFSAVWSTYSFFWSANCLLLCISVSLGTPGNWLLHLGLNMLSFDMAQQQNTQEKNLIQNSDSDWEECKSWSCVDSFEESGVGHQSLVWRLTCLETTMNSFGNSCSRWASVIPQECFFIQFQWPSATPQPTWSDCAIHVSSAPGLLRPR